MDFSKFGYLDGSIVLKDEFDPARHSELKPLPPPTEGRILRDDQIHPYKEFTTSFEDDFSPDLPHDPNSRFFKIWHPSVIGAPMDLINKELKAKNTKFYKDFEQFRSNVWSNRRIVSVETYKKRSYKGQPWFEFTVKRSDGNEYFLTEADFPDVNPNDLYYIWDALNTSTSRSEQVQIATLRVRRFLSIYLWDIFRHDGELGELIAKEDWLRLVPDETLEGIDQRKLEVTTTPELGVIIKDPPGKKFIRARQLHYYKTSYLRMLLETIKKYPKGTEEARTQFLARIEWWLLVRDWALFVHNRMENPGT